jgi:two-component system sensor histidine kinase KdpD
MRAAAPIPVEAKPPKAGALLVELRAVSRYLVAIAIVALSTAVTEVFHRLTGAERPSAVFLGGVVLTAFVTGSRPASLAAGLSCGVYLFLVNPRYMLWFNSPDDLNTLAIFLLVALLLANLTGRARDEASRALRRSRSSAALVAATADFSATAEPRFIRERLASHAANAARGAAVVRDGSAIFAAPEDALDGDVEAATREMERLAKLGRRGTETVGNWTLRPLVADHDVWGVLAWRSGDRRGVTAEELAMLEVLADTGAAAIARGQLAAGKSEAEMRIRTEDLRNALLSSISHDLRTPLAAILASASSLQEFGDVFDAPTRSDLAATIQEEAIRMDDAVANLLNMTRLEAGGLNIRAMSFDPLEQVNRSIARRARARRHQVELEAQPQVPDTAGDPVLFEQAFGNVLENALRYGKADGKVLVKVAYDRAEVRVTVTDDGPGVPPDQLERIFEKFYRAPATKRMPGTGLGLSIARGLLDAMGGWITASNAPGGGLTVVLILPVASAR